MELLHKLENSLNNDAMVALNSRVQIDRASESRAAAEFLNERFQLGIDLGNGGRQQPLATGAGTLLA